MYIVDRIEDNLIILEDKENNKMIEIEKRVLSDVSEGDIVKFIDNKYFIEKEESIKLKESIRDRFNKLKNN